jgi:hypothetical protein
MKHQFNRSIAGYRLGLQKYPAKAGFAPASSVWKSIKFPKASKASRFC